MLGQLATADYGDSKETFLWDGLALLSRNNLKYVNEPAVTGGNPILAGDKVLFDDMLGNTLGVKDGEKFSAIDRDAFGELKPGEKPNLAVNFFTGKPEVDGLGYSFLFRNYRADLGKWQTADPMGYPDGWNNLAYVNNGVTMNIDWQGGWKMTYDSQNPIIKKTISGMGPFSDGEVWVSFANSTSIEPTMRVVLYYAQRPPDGSDRKNFIIGIGDKPSISVDDEGVISVSNKNGSGRSENQYFEVKFSYSTSVSDDKATVSYSFTFIDKLGGGQTSLGSASITLKKEE